QLHPNSPAGLTAGSHPTLDHGRGERRVVDQADLLQAVKLGLHGVGLEAGLDEPALELPAAALPHRQEPKRPLVDVLAFARPLAGTVAPAANRGWHRSVALLAGLDG